MSFIWLICYSKVNGYSVTNHRTRVIISFVTWEVYYVLLSFSLLFDINHKYKLIDECNTIVKLFRYTIKSFEYCWMKLNKISVLFKHLYLHAISSLHESFQKYNTLLSYCLKSRQLGWLLLCFTKLIELLCVFQLECRQLNYYLTKHRNPTLGTTNYKKNIYFKTFLPNESNLWQPYLLCQFLIAA